MAVTAVAERPAADAEDLVVGHAALARSLARRFAGRGEPVEDLEQVAYLGLVLAARRFDPTCGVAFSTFAHVTVLGELKRHFRDKAWSMRVPRRLKEMYLRAKEARDLLAQQLGHSPTVAQIAASIDATDEEVIEAMEAGSSFWLDSLDRPCAEEEADPADQLADVEDGYERWLDLKDLADQLPALSGRDRLVLKMLYVEGRTQREAAAALGVSQMQVSRLHARTIRLLRSRLTGTA